ncbi:MAG: glycosyltransferase family 9 protein [Candidatus Eisenbacteria bacterium]
MGPAEGAARDAATRLLLPDVRRILVLRRRALGDLLLTLPAVRALRESYPGARVDLLVDRPLVRVVEGLPYVDRVVPFPDAASMPRGRGRALLALFRDVRRAGYDLVVDALGTPRTAQLAWWSGARVRAGFAIRGRAWAYTVTVPRSDARRPVYMRDAYLELVAAVGARTADLSFAPAGSDSAEPRGSQPGGARAPGGPRVALAPGATWPAKAWPPAHYAALATRLIDEAQAEVTIFWGPGEEARADQVVAAEPRARKAPPGDVAALARSLRAHDVLVSSDSGARHVAVGAGIATVGLFGPTDIPTATPPEGPHVTLTSPIACAPCQRLTCPLAENFCLTRVLPGDVFAAARQLIAAHAGAAP